MARRVFITVAEVSGDQHAAQFVRALRQLEPDVIVEGYGGPEMAAAGLNILHETTTKAAMTLHGAKRVFEVSRLLKQARQYYRERRPDLQVCVDSSAMNLHFARVAKLCAVPVLYYIAPQLWASREGRIKKVRAYVDRLACILPFEEAWFRERGVNATFVGHPLFDELPADRAARTAGPKFPERAPVIGVVPGSRKSEVAANFPGLIEVMRAIRASFADATFLLPATPAAEPVIRAMLARVDLPVTVKPDAFDELIPRCDLCLTKSGTSTLHVAAWGVPMIVVYHVNPLLWHAIGRWIVKTKQIALVNILAGQRELVPEFVPFTNPAIVAECAIDLLKHPEKLAAQHEQLRALISTLDQRGASMNVARMALEMMNRDQSGGKPVLPRNAAGTR